MVLLLAGFVSAAGASGWPGTWVGIGSHSDESEWSIRITTDPKKFGEGIFGTMDQPSDGCGAMLKLDGPVGPRVKIVERRTYGHDGCPNTGVIELSYDEANDRVLYSWRNPDGDDSASATLERASTVADRILSQAAAHIDPEDNVFGLYWYAVAMGRADRASEVRRAIASAEEKFSANWTPARKSNYFMTLASARQAIGDTAAAIRMLERAHEFALASDKPEDLHSTLLKTAASIRTDKLFSELAEKSPPPEALARAWHTRGETRKARGILEEAVAARRRSNDPARAREILFLGVVFAEMGDETRATEVFELAETELDEIYPGGFNMRKEIEAGFIGSEYLHRANLSRALPRARATFDGKPAAWRLNIIARRLADAGRNAEAIALAEEALGAIEDDQYRLGNLCDIAEVFAMTHQGQKALELLESISRDAQNSLAQGDIQLVTIKKRTVVTLARLGYYEAAIKLSDTLPYASSRLEMLVKIAEIVRG